MSAAEALLARFASFGVAPVEGAGAQDVLPPGLPTGVPELDGLLPAHGFPRGVVELAAPHGVGGTTWLRATTLAALQAREPRALAAWVESPAGPHLHAPALAQLGVDLARLLVVRAPADRFARVAQRLVASGAFALVALDEPRPGTAREAEASERMVRRLGLATETSGSTVLLATDRYAPRATPLPVALRLELTRLPESIAVRIARARSLRGALGADGRTLAIRNVAA